MDFLVKRWRTQEVADLHIGDGLAPRHHQLQQPAAPSAYHNPLPQQQQFQQSDQQQQLNYGGAIQQHFWPQSNATPAGSHLPSFSGPPQINGGFLCSGYSACARSSCAVAMDTGGGSADQFMDVRYSGDDPQSYTAGVPIPGRQQSWAAPEFTQMRDPCSVDELGTSAGGGLFQSPPPSSSIGAGGPFDFANTGSPSPLAPGAVFKPASQEPELSRNLQSIQIDDIFEGVDVCSLLSAPTFSGLHATDDLSDLQLVDATFDGRPLIIKSEEVSSPADWTPSFDADAPFSSSFPRALPPSASSALVGHHDPLLSGSCQSSTPGHRAAGPTLQSLLSRPPLGTAASCSPARAESRQLHQLQMLQSQQSPSAAARLSSSVPADASLSAAAGRLLPPLTTASRMDEARGSGSSISTGGILSPGSLESYLDDGGDSHDESDSDSDAGSVDDDRQLSASLGSRKDRYFWQYNVQSKGPKGQRIQLTPELANPHRVQPPIDPVFSSQFQVQGIKHSGKARRGDGNDLTPSPRKLLSIRRDLDKLNHLITDLTPPSELPFNVRPKSRKEKNKLASRACRLKKKAQHEAYKIQLAGLSEEHKRLSSGLSEMVQLVRARLTTTGSSLSPEETSQRLDRVWRLANKHRVAGHLPDYVQRVLDRMETGPTAAIGGAVGGDFPMTLEPG